MYLKKKNQLKTESGWRKEFRGLRKHGKNRRTRVVRVSLDPVSGSQLSQPLYSGWGDIGIRFLRKNKMRHSRYRVLYLRSLWRETTAGCILFSLNLTIWPQPRGLRVIVMVLTSRVPLSDFIRYGYTYRTVPFHSIPFHSIIYPPPLSPLCLSVCSLNPSSSAWPV